MCRKKHETTPNPRLAFELPKNAEPLQLAALPFALKDLEIFLRLLVFGVECNRLL
jgi:hypothetical protein